MTGPIVILSWQLFDGIDNRLTRKNRIYGESFCGRNKVGRDWQFPLKGQIYTGRRSTVCRPSKKEMDVHSFSSKETTYMYICMTRIIVDCMIPIMVYCSAHNHGFLQDNNHGLLPHTHHFSSMIPSMIPITVSCMMPWCLPHETMMVTAWCPSWFTAWCNGSYCMVLIMVSCMIPWWLLQCTSIMVSYMTTIMVYCMTTIMAYCLTTTMVYCLRPWWFLHDNHHVFLSETHHGLKHDTMMVTPWQPSWFIAWPP